MQLPSLDADSDSRSASGAGIPTHVGGDDVSSLSGYCCNIRSGTGLLSLCWINQWWRSKETQVLPELHGGELGDRSRRDKFQRNQGWTTNERTKFFVFGRR